MPVEMFTDGLEPRDKEATIWRFMNLVRFKDLMSTGELYFCRADLFDDESEGLPPEDYIHVLGLNPLDIRDRQKLNHDLGSIAQFREGFFINCWHLFTEEAAKMWQEYGKDRDGVAVVSRYSLLRSALDSCEGRPHLGQVRYGSKHLTGWNIQRFITTKREKYAHEREVRAALWIPDEFAGINRHFDENNMPHPRPLTEPPDRVPKGQRRKVDLNVLLTGIVVSPWAADTTLSNVERIIREGGGSIPVPWSELTRFKQFLPDYQSPSYRLDEKCHT